MDVGRNDRCLCGSGKKYKRCCGAPRPDPIADLERSIRSVQESAEQKVVRFAYRELGERGLDDAWREFDLTEGKLNVNRNETALFLPWMIYDWEPWELKPESRLTLQFRLSLARMAISKPGASLSEREENFLTKVFFTPTSFHEILAYEPSRTVTLRNLLLEGDDVVVYDTGLTQELSSGDILYARVVAFEGVSLLVGCGDLLIRPIDHRFVGDVKKLVRRRRRKVTAESLCWEESTLRAVYLSFWDQPPVDDRPIPILGRGGRR